MLMVSPSGCRNRTLCSGCHVSASRRCPSPRFPNSPGTLDQTVFESRNRPLYAGPYQYVWADALVVKCR